MKPALYQELRQLARNQLRKGGNHRTLQPTALVHEAYLRLAKQHGTDWSRTAILSIGALMIRRILVDHARLHLAECRGGGRRPVTLSIEPAGQEEDPLELLALHEALERLTALAPRKAQVVELRFFSNLTLDEVSNELQVSRRTVADDWHFARAWLFRELSRNTSDDESPAEGSSDD